MRTTEVEAGCFSETQPSDHLHPVDICRVYSGLCNCLLPAVLHYQPWKWNLINPDRLLIYKTNWQSIKRGVTFQIRCLIHTFFTELAHTLTHTKPLPQIQYYNRIFFFFFFARTGGNKKQPKVKTTHVDRFWIWLMNVVITVLYRWCKLKLHHNSRRQTCHKFKGQLFWHKRFCASWTGSQWNNLYMDRWSVGQFGCKWDFFSLQVRQKVDVQNI